MPKRMSWVSTALARDRVRPVGAQHTAFARPRYRVLTPSGAHSGPRLVRLGVSRLLARRATTALVRHRADPREALADVLGVSTGDIRVRELPSISRRAEEWI